MFKITTENRGLLAILKRKLAENESITDREEHDFKLLFDDYCAWHGYDEYEDHVMNIVSEADFGTSYDDVNSTELQMEWLIEEVL